MAFAPDKDTTFPKPVKDGNGNGGGNGGGPRNMPAFQPGQLNALASQLDAGFGGGFGGWKRNLRKSFDPSSTKEFNFGGGHGGNGNGGKGGDTPGTGPKPGDGGFDPSYPQHRMAPMQVNAQPAMMPQMGLLAGNNMQARPTQSQGILGDIPPEVLAFIRMRGV